MLIDCWIRGLFRLFFRSIAQNDKKKNKIAFYDRWAGIAKGVGVQRIIGRIHMVQIQIENNFLTTSFSVLEEQPMDMLLGLDMLKRHQVSCEGFGTLQQLK